MRRPPASPDTDATVLVRPPAARGAGRRRRQVLGLSAAAGVAVAGGAAWLVWPRHAAPPIAPPAPAKPPPPSPAPAERFTIVPATEQQILDHVAQHLTVFSFDLNPRIIVLDFPGLAEQGAMLDRVAALVEKANLPRARVLNDAELAAAIRATGDTASTWYYGHDYPAAAIERFFALAGSEHIQLNAQEQRLRALAGQLGWLVSNPVGALISIPRAGTDHALTMSARAAILHHELSHGAFFTDPAYAAYVRDFWMLALTPAQRDAIRHFLGTEGYDTADEELMYNEMQAYLFFTPDPEFFEARNIGMTEAERLALRAKFLAGMPPGWLRTFLEDTRLPADRGEAH